VQRRQKLDPRSLLGRGKLDELIIRSLQLGADAIIFDQNLASAQVRAINDATDLKIIDRTQLILDIFFPARAEPRGKDSSRACAVEIYAAAIDRLRHRDVAADGWNRRTRAGRNKTRS